MLSPDIINLGVFDQDIDLFEGQYNVPEGISYNSYMICDEKIAVLDTVDFRKGQEFMENVKKALNGRKPDYLVVHHVEPDHASSVQLFLDSYPEVTLVGNAKTFQMLDLYFHFDNPSKLVVKEGDVLDLGRHHLHFVMAPMVHWPEVMMSYEDSEKILFSADAFGRFGEMETEPLSWDDEGRRYYTNIVGKYGPQVQAVLKKAAVLDIASICPLHGPVLDATIPHVLELYQKWSTYTPESDGILIAYASLHGNTEVAADRLADILDKKSGRDIMLADLARVDESEALSCAFRFSTIVLCASTYNAGIMPAMEDFLHHIKAKNLQKRRIGLMENGSWAPNSAKCMRAALEGLKDLEIVEPVVTIRGALKKTDDAALEALADALLA